LAQYLQAVRAKGLLTHTGSVVEIGLRAAWLRAGRVARGQLLPDWADLADAAYTPPVGQHLVEWRKLGLDTIFGPVELRRDYYSDGRAGCCPADAAWELEGHCTSTLAKWLCRAGADGSYVKAGADLSEFTGVPVDARQAERVVQRLGPAVRPWREQLPQERPALPPGKFDLSYDMTGVPMRPAELRGRKGKQPDGSAKSREVKLGCVFTQTAVDAKGPPIRDPDATTYLSSFRPLNEFGGRMRTAALRRGMASAPGGAVLSDGARCNWEVARSNFPSALQMLDFYHGRAHVGNWVHPLEAKDSPAAQQQRRQWKKRLLTDGVGEIIAQATARRPKSGARRKTAKGQVAYLEFNEHRMQYGTFRKQGYFIGSGVIAAGCKSGVGQRCKLSGMHGSVAGVDNVLDLRCLLASGALWGQFWQNRPEQKRTPLAAAA
jgi:hypothetical protein